MLPRPSLSLSFGVLLAVACSSRAVPDDGMGASSDDAALEAGVQPTAPGSMYSPCETSAECTPQEFCVFPRDESGFCTSACVAPDDPSNCAPPPGDQLQTCFDIALEDGRLVCALDCDGVSCPQGMRCERVASGGGERAICF